MKKMLPNIFGLFILIFSTIQILNSFKIGWNAPFVGDFIYNWPTFWAWKFNPALIEQNPGVIRWLGGSESKQWGYGPVSHFVAFPLMFVHSMKRAFKIWLLFSSVILAVSAGLWYYTLFIRRGLHSFFRLSVFCFIWFTFFPLHSALESRVFEILELFFLTVFFVLDDTGRQKLAGSALALAIMTKFLPAIFLPFLLLRKKYQTFWTAVIVCIPIIVLAQITLGWENSFTFQQIKPVGHFLNHYESQSISSMVQRWFSDIQPFSPSETLMAYPKIQNGKMAIQVSQWIILAMLVFYTALFWVRGRASDCDWFSGCAILLILMVSVIQWNHPYYFLFIVLSFAIAFQRIVSDKSLQNLVSVGPVIVAFILMGRVFSTLFYHTYVTGYFTAIYYLYSVPVWGYLLLLGWFTVRFYKTNTVLVRHRQTPTPLFQGLQGQQS